MEHKRFVRNATASAFLVVTNGMVLFLLYRFLYQTIGAGNVGVWAVILSWTSAGALASFGMPASTVKFVAQYYAREKTDHVTAVIETAAISVASAIGVTTLLLYPLLHWLVPHFIEPAQQQDAYTLLPYAMLSFWITSVTTVLQSCLDGFQRVDRKSILVMISGVIYFVLCLFLVPRYQLIGLAWAQVIQVALLAIITWVAVRHLHQDLPILPYRWNASVFREMLGYNVQAQGVALVQILFDPVAKALLSRYGGAAVVGYFDGANRLAIQLRAPIVSAHLSIIPAIADVQERDPTYLEVIYRTSFRLMLYVFLLAIPILIALSPVFSFLIIGHLDWQFAAIASALFFCWFTNLIGNPAYMSNYGTGHLKWNLVSHTTSSAVIIIAGTGLGILWGAAGVVAAYSVAIVTGALAVMIGYNRTHRFRLRNLTSGDNTQLFMASIASLALTGWFYTSSIIARNGGVIILLVPAFVTLIMAVPAFRHPVRYEATGYWLNSVRT